MPIRKRKVLVASSINWQPTTISHSDWLTIEKKYGQTLSAEVREQVSTATINFQSGTHFEREAAPVTEAQAKLKEIGSATERLLKLVRQKSGKLDGQHYALHLILNHIGNERLGDPHTLPYEDPVANLADVLQSCAAACRSSQVELKDPDYSVRAGDAWVKWVVKLTDIFEAHGLPQSARKDSEKTSPFVAFVRDLQLLMPTDIRRHTQSDQALSIAIQRARPDRARDRSKKK